MSELLGIVVGVSVAVLLFKPLFHNMDEFLECVKYWFTPDIISLFRGADHYWQDHWAELKLGVWLIASGGAGFASMVLAQKLAGN